MQNSPTLPIVALATSLALVIAVIVVLTTRL